MTRPHSRRAARSFLALATLSATFLFCGCSAPPSLSSASIPVSALAAPRLASTDGERSRFQEAEALFLEDRFADAGRGFETFLKDFPESSRTGEALIYAGRCAVVTGSRERGRALLERASTHPNPLVATRAMVELGNVALGEERFDAAEAHFAAAAREAGDPETAAEARLGRGIALQKSGRFDAASSAFESCIGEGTPHRIEARARRRLTLAPWFLVQAGAFRHEKNARNRVAALASAGIPAEIEELSGATGARYRVVSGRFGDRRQAERHRARVTQALDGERLLIVP